MESRGVQHAHAVLIIADDPAFARELVGRWQVERNAPGLTVMSADLFKGAMDSSFDLAIVGPVRPGRLASVLRAVETAKHPVICVLDTAAQAQTVRTDHPRMLALHQHEAWLDSLLLLAGECLRRVDLAARVRKAEQSAAGQASHAALGRYMLKNRHDFNNSLTSVLGNAELLLMDEAALRGLPRDQIETIHAMALHMHAIMQGFSSIAMEMQATEKQSQDETARQSRATFVVS